MYNSKLLNRQIKKYLRGAPIPKEMEGLLAIVDDAYNHYEENRQLSQRALEISSIELNQAKNRISEALSELNDKNNDLLSSIHYARLIQEAILPSEDRFRGVLPESFVYHAPRDIVSGDFYWLQEYDDKILVAAVDCTGHGVPGAFMSIIGNNALNAAVREEGLTTPSLILDSLNPAVAIELSAPSLPAHLLIVDIDEYLSIAKVTALLLLLSFAFRTPHQQQYGPEIRVISGFSCFVVYVGVDELFLYSVSIDLVALLVLLTTDHDHLLLLHLKCSFCHRLVHSNSLPQELTTCYFHLQLFLGQSRSPSAHLALSSFSKHQHHLPPWFSYQRYPLSPT